MSLHPLEQRPNPKELLTLIYITYRAYEAGTFPFAVVQPAEIVEATGLSTSSVRRAIVSLEEFGLLQLARMPGMPHRFRVLIEPLQEMDAADLPPAILTREGA